MTSLGNGSLDYHSIVYIHASSHCGRVSSVVLSPEGGILSSSEFLWNMAMRGDDPTLSCRISRLNHEFILNMYSIIPHDSLIGGPSILATRNRGG